MKDVSWINHPAIKNIDARKLAILVDLINEAEGKPLDKALPILLKTKTKLNALGLSFTNEETSLILDILSKDMSATEKIKFENMKRIIESNLKKK